MGAVLQVRQKVWVGFLWLKWGQIKVCYEYDNEPLVSTEGGNFLK
jgi:hypothetical protein